MYIVLGLLALVFIILGFVGFVGGLPLVVFWALAALCLYGAVKSYRRRSKGSLDAGHHAP